MSNKKIDKPIIIYAAEEIYLKVSNIKKGNPEISVVEAVERYIGSESYNYLGSGEFHNKLFNNLSKKKNFYQNIRNVNDAKKDRCRTI